MSSDTIRDATAEDYTNYPVEFLNSLEITSLPPHRLRLSPSAVVILIRNVDGNIGLCNGVRAVVVQCGLRVLDVLILTGKAKGHRFFLPCIPKSSEGNSLPFSLLPRQYPVKLAWAMTVNMAQGQGLSKVGLLLEEPVFARGQLYVALSRAGSFENIRASVKQTDTQGLYEGIDGVADGTYSENIVYSDILLSEVEQARADRFTDFGPLEQDHADEDFAPDHSSDDVETSRTGEASPPAEHKLLQLDNEVAQLEALMLPEQWGASLPAGAFTGYFERQVLGRCGLRVLDNALGWAFLEDTDMSLACDVHLDEMEMEGNPEPRHLHENEDRVVQRSWNGASSPGEG